ncbi:MAG: SH3 domain-containing protein [Anaerolineales bacterium]|nr:SH3 domain-containing protein [Anaerolineales bacterium]
MAERTLIVDISRYQIEVDFQLLKSKGVAGVIAKSSSGSQSSDHKFVQHVTRAAQAGMIVGAYHWCDPIYDSIRQAENFLRVIENHPVQLVAIDVEQHWRSWDEWYRVQRGEIPSLTQIFTPSQVSEAAHRTAEFVKQRLDMPVLIYTRKFFIKDHARPMVDWIHAYPLWLAEYHIYPDQQISVSWETFKQHFLPPENDGPALPDNCDTWHIWQFTADRISLPGVSGDSELDVNFFNGSLADLQQFIGAAITQPVVPIRRPVPLKAIVQVPLLNVRRGPGTDSPAVKTLRQGQQVEVLNLSGYDVWVKVGPNRWTAHTFRGEPYMQVESSELQAGHLKASVTASLLNVRNGPGIDFEDVGDLTQGEKVEISDLDGNDVWIEIESGLWTAFAFQGRQHLQILKPL